MAETKKSTAAKDTSQSKTPFYLKLLDYYIEQVEKTTPEVIATIKDVQDFYLNGMKTVLKAGEKLGEQSKLKSPLLTKTSNFVGNTASMLMRTQHDCTVISFNANKDLAKMVRKSLTTQPPTQTEKKQNKANTAKKPGKKKTN